MNPMLTRFPESVRIDGVRYPLNTDFRVGLRIMSAYEDPQLTRFERQVVLCRLLYQEQPSDFTQAVREGVRFLDGGEQPRETGGRRLYSFDQDGAYIYSAILQTHGIDLQTVKRMISLRSRREKGLLTKEEKRLWLDMAELLELREADPERDRARTEFEQRMRG